MLQVHKELQQVGNLKRGMPETLESHGISTGKYYHMRSASEMSKFNNFRC